MLEHAINSLIASGPMAVVLGVAVWMLWNALQAERLARAAAEDRQRVEAAIQAEKQRIETAALIKSENDRHQKEETELRNELVGTLKGIAGAMRGDQHAG